MFLLYPYVFYPSLYILHFVRHPSIFSFPSFTIHSLFRSFFSYQYFLSFLVFTNQSWRLFLPSDAPLFVTAPSSQSSEPGKLVTLKCRVDANPPPEIIWRRSHHSKVISQVCMSISPSSTLDCVLF